MLHFATFGTHDYEKQIKRITAEASRFELFQTITGYNPDLLDRSFLEKHGEFMKNNKRGYGFWIWKPQVVLQALKTIPDGDMLVYADAGCTLNHHAKQKLIEYSNIQSNTGITCFQMPPHLEKSFTKDLLFHVMQSERFKDTFQIHATSFFIRKCSISLQIVKDWSELTQNYELINESGKQRYYFTDYRHDQSVWSLLNKLYGSHVISTDETFPPGRMEYPIWGSRIRKDSDSPYTKIVDQF
jgi:hypothetical protein